MSTDRITLAFEGDSAAGGPWEVAEALLRENLDDLYELQLTITTDAPDASPLALLGKSAKLVVGRGHATREVIGIVAELSDQRTGDQVVSRHARLSVRPALEALRHRTNTKIFQEKTVPEILHEVLDDALSGYGRSVDDRLTATYPTCEYRVQYNESDLAFCQRLMQEEGIRHWFEHEGDAETLVLADVDADFGAIEAVDGSSPISLLERDDGGLSGEHLRALDVASVITPNKLTLRHFDWTRPSRPLEQASSDKPVGDLPSGAHVDPAREIYESDQRPLTISGYAGTAYSKDDGAAQVKARREAQAFGARVATGRSNVTGMRPGARFEVQGHPLPEHDGSWLVLFVEHRFTTADGGTDAYENTFRCIPKDVPYRPLRNRARPAIASVETATVVGPSGEEIHTDAHGRIKVQFHWDRLGAMDDTSSCWIRVMQAWAGSGWGFVFLPRIGMEVVVRFVDGDPDRPLVIGSVYSADNQVPYPLPDEKTKSTIKTNSSLGGGGSNELRFEDLAGSEQVFIHAQKDFNEVVENDHTTTVHHDQTIRVDNDQSQEVGNNQTEHVFVDQDLTVDANRTVTVHGDYVETIDGSETRTVSSGSTETIDAGETRTVTGSMTETITGDRSQSIDGDSTESISASLTQTIVGAVTVDTPSTYDLTAVGGVTVIAPAGITIIAPAGHTIVAPGGQTIIDGEWAKSGSDWYDSIAMSFSVQFIKFSWKASAIGVAGLSFEWSTFKLAKKATKLFSYGGVLEKAAIRRKAFAIAMDVAGAHVKAPGG